MPGGAIDFDGTNDGFDADISAIGTVAPIFLHGYFNYDTAATTRTLAYLVDSGDANVFAALTKIGGNFSWTVQSSAGNARTITVSSITAGSWWGVQAYAKSSGGFGAGLRIWAASSTAGSWTTSGIDSGTPGLPSTLDTLYFGYNGSGNFFNGRLAEWYVADFNPNAGDALAQAADMLGRNYTPMHVAPIIFDGLGTLRHYWPMHSASHLTDVFGGAMLTAVDAPTTHDSAPRIIIPGRSVG